jgi:ATP-dependent protease ClpP protease subunit
MNWFAIHRDGDRAIAHVFGSIVFGQTASDFIAQLGDAKSVRVVIDCTGGNSSVALEVYEALRELNTEVEITGRCYSAAVTIAMAGRKIRIHPTGRMMIHRPVVAVMDDSDGLRSSAKNLDKTGEQIVAAISRRSRAPLSQIESWLRSGDHYFTAEEAVSLGLADEIITPEPVPDSPNVVAIPGLSSRAPYTDEENLLFDWLRALGPIPTADRARLMRNLGAHFTYNVKDQ